jgi:hypothetical protein
MRIMLMKLTPGVLDRQKNLQMGGCGCGCGATDSKEDHSSRGPQFDS